MSLRAKAEALSAQRRRHLTVALGPVASLAIRRQRAGRRRFRLPADWGRPRGHPLDSFVLYRQYGGEPVCLYPPAARRPLCATLHPILTSGERLVVPCRHYPTKRRQYKRAQPACITGSSGAEGLCKNLLKDVANNAAAI